MKIYQVKPIDESSVSGLRTAIQQYEDLLEIPFTYVDIRDMHRALKGKLDCVITLRNNSIDEAIPDADKEIAFRQARLLGSCTFKVNLNPNVETLINKASELSNQYIKIVTGA